jgi:hypothetical protein
MSGCFLGGTLASRIPHYHTTTNIQVGANILLTLLHDLRRYRQRTHDWRFSVLHFYDTRRICLHGIYVQLFWIFGVLLALQFHPVRFFWWHATTALQLGGHFYSRRFTYSWRVA